MRIEVCAGLQECGASLETPRGCLHRLVTTSKLNTPAVVTLAMFSRTSTCWCSYTRQDPRPMLAAWTGGLPFRNGEEVSGLPGASAPDLPKEDHKSLSDEALSCGGKCYAPQFAIFVGRWLAPMPISGHRFSFAPRATAIGVDRPCFDRLARCRPLERRSHLSTDDGTAMAMTLSSDTPGLRGKRSM